jgi:RNA polymerase sigma factor (sigma-70 family)
VQTLRPTAEEEQHLISAARNGGRERDRLVDTFMPLIGSVARDYRGAPGIDRAELLQEGVVGLLRALERYDATLGTPFWAYASWWVRQAMQQLVCQLTGPMVLSDRAARMLARVKEARREHYRANGREPSARELALRTGLSLEQVDSLICAERKPRGLDEPVGGDGDVGAALIDTVADPSSENEYEQMPEQLTAESVPDMLAELSARERVVIRGRFGIDCEAQTLRELGAGLGVSAERVRQIERATLRKLGESALVTSPQPH